MPVTTPDDAFEECAVEYLQLRHYPEGAWDTHKGRAWPTPGPIGRYLRPDIVTVMMGTGRVVFVGDAKRWQRLAKRAIDKVDRYREATQARLAAVFVPAACRISATVRSYATEKRIMIVQLPCG